MMLDVIKSCFWLLRCLSWPFLVVGILLVVGEAGSEIREYSFQNFCPEVLRHPLHSLEVTYNRWCDIWWWHPLRVLSRLIPGAFGLLSICLLLRFYLRNTLSGYLFTAIFVSLGSLLRIALYVADPFKHWFRLECLFGRDPSITGLCVQQLGPYGDQTLYLPVMFTLSLWAIYFWQRHKRSKTVTDRP